MSLAAVAALLVVSQGTAPLRKSDIVRLLSGSALSQPELAQLVTRNCLTFDPTDRDRTDFRRLGAEREVLAAVDECARRRPLGHAVRPAAVSVPAAARPAPARPAPDRTVFAAGGGQRGAAGARLPRALVFDVRDSAGVPLAGHTVTFTGVNARIDPAAISTDAGGQARVAVILGEHTGSATVLATVGAVEKQVAFHVVAGAAAQLVVTCGATSLSGRFAIRPDSVLVLRVAARDAYANPTPLSGLRAAVADARVARVLRITADSASGTVALKPAGPGTTSLAVIANGMRQYLMVTVPPRAASGQVDCG